MSPNNKIQKSKGAKNPIIPNKEGFSRASFLYQASQSMSFKNEVLSRMYSKTMDLVTKKSVLKLDPNLKRTLCKKCNRLQIVGASSSMALANARKPSETYHVKCKCGEMKRYPLGKNREYVLFSERVEHTEVEVE